MKSGTKMLTRLSTKADRLVTRVACKPATRMELDAQKLVLVSYVKKMVVNEQITGRFLANCRAFDAPEVGFDALKRIHGVYQNLKCEDNESENEFLKMAPVPPKSIARLQVHFRQTGQVDKVWEIQDLLKVMNLPTHRLGYSVLIRTAMDQKDYDKALHYLELARYVI